MATDSNNSGRYEGFADYSAISQRVASDVAAAVDAYARLDAAHSEGRSIPADSAAESRAAITAAATTLIPELQHDRDRKPLYDQILARWLGDEDVNHEGRLNQLDEIQLQQKLPGWLFQVVIDIKRAAFELGYLQAGHTVNEERKPADPTEAQTDRMFGGE